MILAGDIGGTKARLGLFEVQDGRPVPVLERTFASREHGSLDDIVAKFCAGHGCKVELACFGVAGPVRAGATRKPVRQPAALGAALLGAALHASSLAATPAD